MNYSDLSGETQLFLNKAMDIYSIIKDKSLNRTVKDIIGTKDYEFTKLDKKVLALFIAGLLVEGNLKEIFSQYDDIKLDDLFDFIGIKESDITPIEDEKYEEFFDKNIKLDLVTILKESNRDNTINFVTPEVVISSLQDISLSGSEILEYYKDKYNLKSGGIFISEHPLFRALENYTLIDGSVSKKDSPKGNNVGLGSSLFATSPLKKGDLKPLIQTQKQKKVTKFDDSVWQLLDEIQKKFIGQEVATEGLFYNIVNNQQLAEMEDIPDGQRSIIFIDGPTGTGKTAITREITEKLGIPFTSSSVTNYSSTGYVGGDIIDVLKELYRKANGDIEKAQRGIIVFDEFDKIAYSRSGGLEMKKAVQQQLLDFLGGGKYNIRVGNSIFDMNEIEFDTSKLTFVCLGALTDLRSKKTETRQTIGFGQTSQSSEEQTYSIIPQDLMSIGLERELVGRFNTYLHTDDYSKESLEKILRESTISPLIGFKKWIEARGKQLVIDEDVYGLIAEQAYELNTGARSLQTVMNNIRTPFIREVLRGTDNTIYLDSETVIKENGQTMNRKWRV
ncbi:AAA family ATPase [bacterium]|nr:AAA family ATPase [bacterium]